MNKQGVAYIAAMKGRWVFLRFLTVLFYSIMISVFIAALLVYFLSWPVWVYLLTFVLVFSASALFTSFWKLNPVWLTRYLDQQYPELEESSSLLLTEEIDMLSLQKLQLAKVISLLPPLGWPGILVKRTALAFGGMLLVLSVILLMSGARFSALPVRAVAKAEAPEAEAVKKVPAKVANVKLTIVPPAYTGLPARQQSALGLRVEDGSSISWKIQTSARVEQMKVVFNDKEVVVLNPTDSSRRIWTFNQAIHHSGFYQMIVDGMKSDLYAIELIADLPVRIKVLKPKQTTVIDYAQPALINLQVNLEDEYGIKDATIALTLASGKGEGVSFSNKNMAFTKVVGGQKKIELSQQLDLRRLGMKPGDEMYFFIKALDNRNQSSRSDVYFVTMVDTAELMSMNGMVGGVNLVPEYFRSQRQIIIDTEKLLREQNAITLTSFKDRSNNLGLDQKLLRLRYGKFLGEENENEIGPSAADHDHEEGHEHSSNEEQTKALMESYTHQHDVAEDATFFEPELKAQLKTVLTEMWKAELQLRTFKLQEALPFEYKALRLLKDLQQKSRAYVAKTTVKVPQLKEEKRLSGELDKILSPLQQQDLKNSSQRERKLKMALGLLELPAGTQSPGGEHIYLLQEVEKEMVVAAADRPASFLPALKEIRVWSRTGSLSGKGRDIIARAVQKMMLKENALPQQRLASPAADLYQNYYLHLNKLNQ